MEAYKEQHPEQTLLFSLTTKVIPSLFAHKLALDRLRVWIAGCRTGEVAYTIAGMLLNYAQQRLDPPSIQIFATDSERAALMIARAGQYPNALSSRIIPEWLNYFTYDGEHYHVLSIIRHLITFASHDILHDPPFAHLDVIVCPYLFTTLTPEAQEEVIRIFHWSLQPHGYLFLNPAVGVSNLHEYFVPQEDVPGLFYRRSITTATTYIPRYSADINQETLPEVYLSINRHLQTMNQTLRHKVSELVQANNDLANLMSATNVATVFLDRALQITRFTPQAQTIFNLLPTDRGRPLAHITHILEYEQLVEDANEVLVSLQSIEREVGDRNGGWYLVRIRPYRTTDERIDGVVLVCVDITARRLAEEQVRQAHNELELRVRERTEELSSANTQLEVEIAERKWLEEARSELLRKLVMAQEEERRHVARELHDQMGQSLTALGIGLQGLADPTLDPAQQQAIVARLRRIATQIDQEMKQLALELRPTVLDDLGLIEAIQHAIERWTEHTGIQVDFQTIAFETIRLPQELENVIYRMIQEALTNVFKHAKASSVSVILEQRRDHVSVIVEDNGSGFDLNTLQETPDSQAHLGLLGMRERLALVGGKLTIETAPGAGTTMFAQLPIPPNERSVNDSSSDATADLGHHFP